jgi:hypothetical protein
MITPFSLSYKCWHEVIQASSGPLGDIVNTFFGSGDSEEDKKNPMLNGFKVRLLWQVAFF